MGINVIHSVLGFNLKTEIFDNDGQPIKTGAKRIDYISSETPNVGTKIGGETWFTNFNEALLSKIRDYRRRND
jgi:hypothetical protein